MAAERNPSPRTRLRRGILGNVGVDGICNVSDQGLNSGWVGANTDNYELPHFGFWGGVARPKLLSPIRVVYRLLQWRLPGVFGFPKKRKLFPIILGLGGVSKRSYSTNFLLGSSEPRGVPGIPREGKNHAPVAGASLFPGDDTTGPRQPHAKAEKQYLHAWKEQSTLV